MKKNLNSVRIEGSGIPCPRCEIISELRYHKVLLPKLLKQPFYYKQWFYCVNALCRTKTFMREEDKVFPITQQVNEQQDHLFNINRETL